MWVLLCYRSFMSWVRACCSVELTVCTEIERRHKETTWQKKKKPIYAHNYVTSIDAIEQSRRHGTLSTDVLLHHVPTLDHGTTLIHSRSRGDNGRVAHKQRSQYMKCVLCVQRRDFLLQLDFSHLCKWTCRRKKKKSCLIFFLFTHNDLSLSRQRQFRLPLSECGVCIFLVLRFAWAQPRFYFIHFSDRFVFGSVTVVNSKAISIRSRAPLYDFTVFFVFFFLCIFSIFVSDGMSRFDTTLGGGSTSEWRILRWILNVEFSVHMLCERWALSIDVRRM